MLWTQGHDQGISSGKPKFPVFVVIPGVDVPGKSALNPVEIHVVGESLHRNAMSGNG